MKMWLSWWRARARAGVWVCSVLFVALCLTGGRAAGQCGDWSATGMPALPVGGVLGMVAWDPDGPGPTPEWLVLESTYQIGDLVTTVAAWDGSVWHDLRPNSLQSLRPLCSIGNDLVAVLPGVTSIDPSFIVRVHADRSMTVIGDSRVMPVPTSAVSDGNVAYFFGSTGVVSPFTGWCGRYDGSTWTTIPADFRAGTGGGSPWSKVIWNGQLVVSGNFTSVNGQPMDRIALWNGGDWVGLTAFPASNASLSVGVFQDQLFVTADRHPMRWTGNGWQVPALEAFPAGQWPPGGFTSTYVVYSPRGVYLPQWGRKYDGVTWVSYDSAMMTMPLRSIEWQGKSVLVSGTSLRVIENDVTLPLTDALTNPPSALAVWNGELIVGGVRGAGGRKATPLVAWDARQWRNLEQPGVGVLAWEDLSSMRQWGNLLLAGQYEDYPDSYYRLYVYDGVSWDRAQPQYWNSVSAIETWNGQPVVLGRAQGTQRLARLNQGQWIEIVSSSDAALIHEVAVSGGSLIVAGSFTQVAGVAANRVAAWDGSDWTSFGDGPPSDGVSCLGVYRGSPVVSWSGSCWWWNGIGWVSVDSSGYAISFLVEYNDDLIFPGTRTRRWSPEQGLRPLGRDEVEEQGSVYHAVVVGNTLYLAGDIYRAGGVPAAYCVAWRDTTDCDCDSIDFNRDGVFPDIADIPDFLSVFQGGLCARQLPTAEGPCNWDIDFNNDGLFPDTLDIEALLSVFSGGPCV